MASTSRKTKVRTTKKEVDEILQTLNNGNFHIECPFCEEEINPSEAGLFYLDQFTTEAREIYNSMLVDQKERRASIKERKLNIPEQSEVGARAVSLGFLLELLAPTLDGFTFNKNDCRSLLDPIDYVIFEGLSAKKAVSKILFVDIKTGKARLTPRQKKIKSAIEEKKVEFKRYQS